MRKVLFIHGFSARQEDNDYFIKYLQKHKNIQVNTFVLPGHEKDKIIYTSYKEWLKKAENEFLKLNSKKVILIGHSMGAVIAANLASKYKVKKLILLSPAYYFGSLNQNIKDIKSIIRGNKEDTGFEGLVNKIKNVPLKSFIEYCKLSHLCRKDLEKITCPILIMHGDKDSVIDIKSINYILKHLKTTFDFVCIKDVRHQLFKSNKKKQISIYIYHYICGGLIYMLSKRKEI